MVAKLFPIVAAAPLLLAVANQLRLIVVAVLLLLVDANQRQLIVAAVPLLLAVATLLLAAVQSDVAWDCSRSCSASDLADRATRHHLAVANQAVASATNHLAVATSTANGSS